jgi:hypothetical protein
MTRFFRGSREFGRWGRKARIESSLSRSQSGYPDVTPPVAVGSCKFFLKMAGIYLSSASIHFLFYDLIIGLIEISVTSAVRGKLRALITTDAISAGCSNSSGR